MYVKTKAINHHAPPLVVREESRAIAGLILVVRGTERMGYLIGTHLQFTVSTVMVAMHIIWHSHEQVAEFHVKGFMQRAR
jgi:hypothetical protein